MKLTEAEKAEARKAFDGLATKLYDMCILLVETNSKSFPDDTPDEIRKQVIESMLQGTANAMAAGVEEQIKTVTEKLKEKQNG